jgi:hypothetical protein
MRLWLVDAIGFGGQIIAGNLISASPASAANSFELTVTAFPFEMGKVP